MRPLTMDDVAGKFRDCAAAVLDPGHAERALAALQDIEEVADAADLVALLVPQGPA
jgi:hypothetical protein